MALTRRSMRPRNLRSRREFEAELQRALVGMSPSQLGAITKAIGQATRVIMAKLAAMERKMDVKVNDLLDAVEAQQSKIDSLVELANQLYARVIAAMGGEENLTPSQKMRLAQVFDAVKANSDDIDKALAANTVDASKGAISDGPSAAEIKNDLNNDPQPTGSGS